MTNPTKVTLHRDRTCTYWSVYEQRWVCQPIERVPERELAAMTPDARARVLRVLERHERAGASPPESARPLSRRLMTRLSLRTNQAGDQP